MRLLFLLICLAVLATGALFGALNPTAVEIDVWFVTLELRLGLALLLAGLAGAAIGGLAMWLGVVLPMAARLRRAQRESRSPAPVTQVSDDDA
jgi:uncharacterized integral membrane protein